MIVNHYSSLTQVLPDRGFLGLRKLRSLDLSASPRLSLVTSTAFQDLPNLSWLSLSSCPALALQSAALLPLTGLRTLHMAHLGWTTLDRLVYLHS